jgi:hypothetical protein
VKSRLVLARFLLGKSRAEDALGVLAAIDHGELVASSEGEDFLNALMNTKRLSLAHDFWLKLKGASGVRPPMVWNGGFESDIAQQLNQFDWAIKRSDYVRISLDPNVYHSGSRSLRLDFVGRETTRLDQEVKQVLIVTPGRRYRVECFVKTAEFETPDGPRLVVLDGKSPESLYQSEPIAGGSSDWRRLSLTFTAPEGVEGVQLLVRQIPRYSYVEPTRGTLWFDDFTIAEIAE